MTIQKDVVLWDNGRDRLCLLHVAFEQQYNYIDGLPCITFGISYENANYKGFDTFTLFDHFYVEMINKAENTYHNLNGVFCIKDVGVDTDGYINFEMNRGILLIKGQLGASFSPHSLRFEFEADQTLIGVLLQNITV